VRTFVRAGRLQPADLAAVSAMVLAGAWAGLHGPAAIRGGLIDPQAMAVAIAPLAILLALVAVLSLHRTRALHGRLGGQAHRASAMLASVVASADDAIIVLAPDGSVTGWNQGACDLFGVDPRGAIGRSFSEFVVPAETLRVAGLIAVAASESVTERSSTEYVRADGTTFQGLSSFSPILDRDRTVLGSSVIVRDATAQVRHQHALAQSEQRFRLLAASATDAVVSTDSDGCIVAWNPAATAIFGYAAEEMIGRPVRLLLAPHLRDPGKPGGLRLAARHWGRLAGRTVEVIAVRKDGEAFPAEVTVATWHAGDVLHHTAFVRDVSDRMHAAFRLGEREMQYRLLVDQVPAIVFRTDAGPLGRTQFVSHQVERILGFAAEQWIADPGLWERQVHPDDRERLIAGHEAAMAPDGPGSHSIEYRMTRADGREIWVRSDAAVVRDGAGHPEAWSGILTEITDRKELEAQLIRQSFRDPLTNLANQALFEDRLGQAIARRARHSGSVAVLMIGLDPFDRVTDRLGHTAGDELLVEVARRVALVVREGDTVARMGSAAFAVILEDIPDVSVATEVADRIVAALHAPVELSGVPTQLTARVGIAVDDTRSRDSDWLVRSADVAMHAATRDRNGRWRVHEPGMYLTATRHHMLATQLHGAQENGQFEVVYQPTVDLRAGRVTGVEALLRWRHPRDGLVLPTQLIPMAEASGLMVPIGRWVLAEACRQASEWETQFGTPRTMAVNISPCEFDDEKFTDTVARALDASNLAPSRLVLELTERHVTAAQATMVERLSELKRIGVRIALDDFGTADSSLSYLRQLPVDILKINRSFVDGIVRDPEAAALARSIVQLGALLQLETVAEGIEDPAQVAALQDLGCYLGQGFYFSRPLQAREITALLAESDSRLPQPT
jgi:diguanylate cyclase (GGDEF)-like protein/PAS domain S-box-containing protein